MYCPKCGKENPDDARFCMHCGADLSEYEKILIVAEDMKSPMTKREDSRRETI